MDWGPEDVRTAYAPEKSAYLIAIGGLGGITIHEVVEQRFPGIHAALVEAVKAFFKKPEQQ